MPEPTLKSDKQHRRSPFKTPPPRLPGQSIEERITSLRNNIADYLETALCFFVVACYTWIQWWLDHPLHPVVFTLVAIITMVYAAIKIRPVKSQIRNLQIGKEGERQVAHILDPLREKGYQVFHDIPGPDFNIDHVIIGPGGIYTIETKTRSKPIHGTPKVIYDGNALRINNGRPVDEPLNQARAQARWLANHLNHNLRRIIFTVRPVVVFPEWYVERTASHYKGDVWVLNPKALDKFLDHEAAVLSEDLIDQAAHTLTHLCRQTVD